MERTVLISVDHSAHSRAAFDWFMKVMYRPGDSLIICHIPEAPELPSFSFKSGLNVPYEDWIKAINEQVEKVKKLEVEYESELQALKIPYKVRGEQRKNPGDGIVSIAEQEKADFIVMGTRGLDPVRRTLLGSVSDFVIRHSKIPVLVCPR